MPTRKNRKLIKLRQYRDKLLERKTNLENTVQAQQRAFLEIRKCLQAEDTLRAYALASGEWENQTEGIVAYDSDLQAHMTLLLRLYVTLDTYINDIELAIRNKDFIRVLALTSQFHDTRKHQEKLLGPAFAHIKRKEINDGLA